MSDDEEFDMRVVGDRVVVKPLARALGACLLRRAARLTARAATECQEGSGPPQRCRANAS